MATMPCPRVATGDAGGLAVSDLAAAVVTRPEVADLVADWAATSGASPPHSPSPKAPKIASTTKRALGRRWAVTLGLLPRWYRRRFRDRSRAVGPRFDARKLNAKREPRFGPRSRLSTSHCNIG